MLPPDASGWIAFGHVARAHGVRGELRIAPMHPETALPAGLERLRLRPRHGGAPLVMRLRSVRPTHGAVLVTLVEVTSRESAQALAGATVEIEIASLPPLAAGEVYLYELVGAEAVDADGVPIGTVEQLLDNRGQDVLVLRGPGGEERMLPLAEDTLVELDRDRRRVVLRVTPGLWDA